MELITLQFGPYANFVGTHYWNIQDEQFKQDRFRKANDINYDSLGRVAEAQGTSSYAPRVLLFDYKGGLGELRRSVKPIDTKQLKFNAWSDRAEIFEQDFSLANTNSSSQYDTNSTSQKKESKYKVWSAFSTSNLNPDKNTHELDDFNIDDHYDNQEGLVGSFTEIEGVYRPLMLEEMSDKLRVMTEACNGIQGFQVIVEVSAGAMGALSSKFLEYLRYEESYKQPVLTLAINNNLKELSLYDTNEYHIRDKLNQLALNRLLAQSKLQDLSSLYVPVETKHLINKPYFPLLNIDTEYDAVYHTSAIVASAFDTLTSVYRLSQGTNTMASLIGTLARGQNNHKLASLSFALPFNYLTAHKKLNASRLLADTFLYKSPLLGGHLLPVINTDSMPNAEAIVLRGVNAVDTTLPENANLNATPQLNALAHIDSVESALLAHMNDYGCSSRLRSVIKSGLALPSSYPTFFNEQALKYGNMIPEYEGGIQSVHNMPTMSYLAAGNRLRQFVRHEITEFGRIDFARYPQFQLDKEDISNLNNELQSLAEHNA